MSNPIDTKTGDPVCNLDYLTVNLGRNKEAARRLVSLFLENYSPMLTRLETAARAGDIPAMQDAVHDIRGSCVLFSAHQALASARELEYVLHCHRGDGLEIDWLERSQGLRSALAEVRQQLAQYIELTSDPDTAMVN